MAENPPILEHLIQSLRNLSEDLVAIEALFSQGVPGRQSEDVVPSFKITAFKI